MHSLNFYMKMKTSDRIMLVLSSHNSAQPLSKICARTRLMIYKDSVGHKEDPSIGMCFLIPM